MARKYDRYCRREILRAIGFASLLGGGMAWADEPEKSVPEQIVDTMNALFGKHPGFRSAHAKGIVCEGEFTPSTTAPTLSRAPHLQGKPVRVTVRFSDSTGIPNIPDGAPDASPHGMAVKFHLPETSTDIVTNAFNGFAVATPEDFLALLRPIRDRAELAKAHTDREVPRHAPQGAESRRGPEADAGQLRDRALLRCERLPLHEQRWQGPVRPLPVPPRRGEEVPVRRGRRQEAGQLPHRRAGRPACKGPGEVPTRRPTRGRGRPGRRRDGRLARRPPHHGTGHPFRDQAVGDNDAAQRALAFDPLHLVDGIEGSDDPLLEARSTAYAISRRRRR